MIHPLARKELREHRGVLVAMGLLCLLWLAMALLAARLQGSPVMAWRSLLALFAPLLALALANRFVVREYGGRTQLFLETLPMSRAQVITVKWLTSLACLLAPMMVAFGLVLLVARYKVDLTPRFVMLLALRGFVFLVFIHALAFFVGLMGRYRYVLWLALAVLVAAANFAWQLPPKQWPPVQLVDEAMAFEREAMPVQALWLTAVIAASVIAAAFALALGFQGSWVVALAKRMSLREKVVVAATFFCTLYVIFLLDDRKPKPPFSIANGVTSGEGLPRVTVANADGVSGDVARELSRSIATSLQQASDFLAMAELPVVAVMPDTSIDPELFQLAKLPDSDGVVVRGAIGVAGFDEAAFRAFTVRQVLDWYTRRRASLERRRWLVDGFTLWQATRDDVARRKLLASRSAAALQLLESGGMDLAQALGTWLGAREQLGDCLGDALAWRATEWLSASLGEARFQQLSRALFSQRPPVDVRAVLDEKPVDQLLQAAGAPATRDLAVELRRAIQAEARDLGITAPSRQWSVRLEAVAMGSSLLELHHSVLRTDGGPAPAYAVRYLRIGPWDGELSRAGMERVDAGAAGVVPASFAHGERLFTAVELYSPQLQCTLRLGARRWQLP